MTLRDRVQKLESSRKPARSTTGAKEILLERINSLALRLAGDCQADQLNASPMERVALAFNRGDAAFASELLVRAAKGGNKDAA